MRPTILNRVAFVLLLASVGIFSICITLFGVVGVVVRGVREALRGDK